MTEPTLTGWQRDDDPSRPPLLRLHDVSVVRQLPTAGSPVVRILDHVSLTIAHREHTLILGANGSGKSSLLKLLLRQFYPSVDDGHTGDVEIWGGRGGTSRSSASGWVSSAVISIANSPWKGAVG